MTPSCTSLSLLQILLYLLKYLPPLSTVSVLSKLLALPLVNNIDLRPIRIINNRFELCTFAQVAVTNLPARRKLLAIDHLDRDGSDAVLEQNVGASTGEKILESVEGPPEVWSGSHASVAIDGLKIRQNCAKIYNIYIISHVHKAYDYLGLCAKKKTHPSMIRGNTTRVKSHYNRTLGLVLAFDQMPATDWPHVFAYNLFPPMPIQACSSCT